MLEGLAIGERDSVVEFAPGLGITARLALQRKPAEYVGVERDEVAAATVKRQLAGPRQRCVVGSATATGLGDASATVVYGEAMLSMQTEAQKVQIVNEALRLLKPGGRYGIHELALAPDDLPDAAKDAVARDLSQAIHVGARPLTVAEWRTLLESAGFRVESCATAPMHLLEPRRVIRDEGLLRALRIAFNVLRTPAARRRVLAMRKVFGRHDDKLCAVALVAKKIR